MPDWQHCGARSEPAEEIGGTFEPLLGGDRQTEKRVPKVHNPLQWGRFEVSLL